VPPVGNMLESVELTARYNAQNTFSSQHGIERNQAPSLQIFLNLRYRGMPTLPSIVQVRKRQAAPRTTQRQKTKTPPLHTQQSTSPLPHPNVPQYMGSSRASLTSTPTNLVTTGQSTRQPKLGQRYSVPQSPQSYDTHPLVSEYQSASSSYHAQTREDNTYAISRDPLVNLQPPSFPVPITVDPSHVHNRYHEYQKQIEAADVEDARLAALEADREAVEAAAAALASAKSITQNEIVAQSHIEDERTIEAGRQSKILNQPAQNSKNLSNLISTDQTANRMLPTLSPQLQIHKGSPWQRICRRSLPWKRKCV
jgi:hypothetical protein